MNAHPGSLHPGPSWPFSETRPAGRWPGTAQEDGPAGEGAQAGVAQDDAPASEGSTPSANGDEAGTGDGEDAGTGGAGVHCAGAVSAGNSPGSRERVAGGCHAQTLLRYGATPLRRIRLLHLWLSLPCPGRLPGARRRSPAPPAPWRRPWLPPLIEARDRDGASPFYGNGGGLHRQVEFPGLPGSIQPLSVRRRR